MTDASSNAPERVYVGRRDAFAARHADLTRRWNRVSNLRLLAFAVVAVATGWFVVRPSFFLAIIALAAFGVFLWLVRKHRALGRERTQVGVLRDLNAEALARLARDWAALPLRHEFRPDPSHPFAADLDLFGRASVFHLLDATETPMGQAALRDALLIPATNGAIRRRQEAVAALASELAWRQDLAARGRVSREDRRDPEPFLRWAEHGAERSSPAWLIWLTRISTVLLIVTAVANLAGWLTLPIWLIFALINLGAVESRDRAARNGLSIVAEQHHAIGGYAGLLEALVNSPADTAMIRVWKERLRSGEADAPDRLRQLSRASAWVIPRSALLYFPLQLAFAWDLHVLDRLEGWRARSGRRVRDWLDVIGEAEMISSLAGLAHDHPAWTFPTVDSAADSLVAAQLGHPLLSDHVRVANDVTVGPPGTFFLLTGSNMSGKSTLLRAIGVNIVLANAGSCACAASLTLPPVRLWTSVRVQDSLEAGISFFMAELMRLKAIVDAAEGDRAGEPRLFYLLDEILQGTNTAERQIAARQIIRRLVDRGAIGAVSTHDLTLVDGPELADAARLMHLVDQVTGSDGSLEMRFDYKLRPGLATSTNALKLMEIVFGR